MPPRGLLACDNQFGEGYSGRMIKVAFAATDATLVAVGSLVSWTGGSLDSAGKVPLVTLATPTTNVALAGAIQNFDPERDGNWTQYFRAANQLKFGFIPADPKCLYQIQEDGDGGNIDPATDIGSNIALTTEAINTLGFSTQQLDSSTAAVTATLPIRLHNVVDREDNDGTSASTNATWIVSLNVPHELAALGL